MNKKKRLWMVVVVLVVLLPFLLGHSTSTEGRARPGLARFGFGSLRAGECLATHTPATHPTYPSLIHSFTHSGANRSNNLTNIYIYGI